jgi:hypothetical protein
MMEIDAEKIHVAKQIFEDPRVLQGEFQRVAQKKAKI